MSGQVGKLQPTAAVVQAEESRSTVAMIWLNCISRMFMRMPTDARLD